MHLQRLSNSDASATCVDASAHGSLDPSPHSAGQEEMIRKGRFGAPFFMPFGHGLMAWLGLQSVRYNCLRLNHISICRARQLAHYKSQFFGHLFNLVLQLAIRQVSNVHSHIDLHLPFLREASNAGDLPYRPGVPIGIFLGESLDCLRAWTALQPLCQQV